MQLLIATGSYWQLLKYINSSWQLPIVTDKYQNLLEATDSFDSYQILAVTYRYWQLPIVIDIYRQLLSVTDSYCQLPKAKGCYQ